VGGRSEACSGNVPLREIGGAGDVVGVGATVLDRFHIAAEVEWDWADQLRASIRPESSAKVAARVAATRAVQYRRNGGRLNAALDPAEARRAPTLGRRERDLLERAQQRMGLSPRALLSVLRVARTIADLTLASRVGADHLAEALYYRDEPRSRPE
jgi:magnesium chelatase family protein